jgi:hypothetical protein
MLYSSNNLAMARVGVSGRASTDTDNLPLKELAGLLGAARRMRATRSYRTSRLHSGAEW